MLSASVARDIRPWMLSGVAFVLVFACEATVPPTAIYTVAQQQAAAVSVLGEWATDDGRVRVTVCETTPPTPSFDIAVSSHASTPLAIESFECNDTVGGCGVAHASCVQSQLVVPITMQVTGDVSVAGDYQGVVSFGVARADSLNNPLSTLRRFSVQRPAVFLNGSYSEMNDISLDGFSRPESDAGTNGSTLHRVGDAVCP